MMNHPISSPYIDIATTKGMLNHVKHGSMLLVSITIDHTLKSRMMGNYHVRFGSGGGEGDFFANHNHQELSQPVEKGGFGMPCTPAMASGLTDHIWSVWELLTYKVAPPPLPLAKQRGRPRSKPLPDPTQPKRPRGRPRQVPLCSSTS